MGMNNLVLEWFVFPGLCLLALRIKQHGFDISIEKSTLSLYSKGVSTCYLEISAEIAIKYL